jgi:hypothetical protein
MAYSAPFTYTIVGSNCTIIACDVINGALNIPTSLDGYVVTLINASVCKNKNITSLTLPNTLINVGANCFDSSGSPGNSFTSVTIPSSLTYLGAGAFANSNLDTLTINATTISTTSMPFENCSIGDGLTIGSSVTAISGGLLRNSGLTSVTFPASVTNIGTNSFAYNNITDLTIPSTLTYIGITAFQGNELSSLTLNATVTSTTTTPFLNCAIGDGLTIGASVTSIPSQLFKYAGLTSVTFPASVTNIGSEAFSYNELLLIDLPETITTVGNSAFQDNPRLANVYVRNDSITLGGTILTNDMVPRIDRIVPKLANALECMLLASDGSVYVGEYSGGRLLSWNEGTNTFDVLAEKYGTITTIYALCELNGDIYGAGTTGRLLVLTPSGWQSVAPPNGLTTITSLSILNNSIYAVGSGTRGLLEWDGVSVWNQIILSSTASIASCEYEGEIYAESGTGNLYKWYESSFILVAARYTSNNIRSLFSFQGNLYAKYDTSGAFVKLNDTKNGWDLIGTASTGTASHITTDGTYLYFHVWNKGIYRSTGEIGNLTQITNIGLYSIKDLIYKNSFLYGLDAGSAGGIYELIYDLGVIYANDPSNGKTWWANHWTETYTFSGLEVGWVKKWDGANWVIVFPKRWDGANWVNCNVKRWDGANWV